MNEVNRPKKPLALFYCIAAAVILLINLIVMPMIAEKEVETVDYGKFMSMTENKEIGLVEITSNQIIFTNKDQTKFYKTGLMNDPNLTERLYNAGAQFSSQIIEETSPFLTLLLSWALPIIVFIAIGQFMSRKMMDKAGGGPGSLMFNMGKSNAKVYVKSSDGIHFSDVGQISGDRCFHAEGRAACRPSGHGQNDACKSRRRRGKRSVLLHVRL